MSTHELELQLRALGAEIDFPPEPDLRAAVRDHVARRRFGRRRWLAIALAVLVVALAGVLAVPSARSTIQDWLGLGDSVRFHFVDELPDVRVPNELDLGTRVTLADARERTAFKIVVPPDDLGKPAIYLRDPPRGGLVSFLYGTPAHANFLISEFRGDYRPFIQKTIGQTQVTALVDVNGQEAYWLKGNHIVEYLDAAGQFTGDAQRLSGPVLLWRRGNVTFRLEGPLTQEQAIDIAEAVT